jgi:hypothetical protein
VLCGLWPTNIVALPSVSRSSCLRSLSAVRQTAILDSFVVTKLCRAAIEL